MSRKPRREKVVTVCLANAARSPTAEWLLLNTYRVKSCGTSLGAHKPCDKIDMAWADYVLVMEDYQKKSLEERFPHETAGKITVLQVPEIGKYACQDSLIWEIRDRLKENGFKPREIKNIEKDSEKCMDYIIPMAERKDRARVAKTYALTDYWSPYQAQVYTQEEFEQLRQPTSWTTEAGDYEEWIGATPLWDVREREKRKLKKPDRFEETGERMLRKEKSERKMLAELKKYTDALKDIFK